jgi:hypothetical protein
MKTIVIRHVLMAIVGIALLVDTCVANGVPLTDNLVIHLDAGAGVFSDAAGTVAANDGDPVAFWQDQAPLGGISFAGQVSATQNPTLVKGAMNGQDVLRFDRDSSTNLLLTNASVDDGAMDTLNLSWFVVGRSPDVGPEQSFARMGIVGRTFLYGTFIDTQAINNAGTVHAREHLGGTSWAFRSTRDNDPGLNNDVAYIIGGFWDGEGSGLLETRRFGSDGSSFQESVSSPASTAVPVEFDTMRIGNHAVVGGTPLNGDIAEILIYNTFLNAEDRAAVVSYLNSKYGIPEPSSVVLLALGGFALAMFGCRRR